MPRRTYEVGRGTSEDPFIGGFFHIRVCQSAAKSMLGDKDILEQRVIEKVPPQKGTLT